MKISSVVDKCNLIFVILPNGQNGIEPKSLDGRQSDDFA